MSKTQSTAISDEIINLIQDEPEGKKDALNLYYRDLSKYPTLSPEEEFLVCQRIQQEEMRHYECQHRVIMTIRESSKTEKMQK